MHGPPTSQARGQVLMFPGDPLVCAMLVKIAPELRRHVDLIERCAQTGRVDRAMRLLDFLAFRVSGTLERTQRLWRP